MFLGYLLAFGIPSSGGSSGYDFFSRSRLYLLSFFEFPWEQALFSIFF